MSNPFKELPPTFQKKYSSKSYSCECIKTGTINYELYIRVVYANNIHGDNNDQRFYIYYEPNYSFNFAKNPKRIGHYLGMGLPLDEAIASIKEALKNSNISLLK